MHPLAQDLVNGWIPHFQSADAEITWFDIEREHMVWLDDLTLLLGRIDATGLNSERAPFFADWKSASSSKARRMDQVKAEWRFNPQALTYGVLCDIAYPGMRTFTVRWAIKPSKFATRPTYNFEWYTYSTAELSWWRTQVLDIASTIRRRRSIASTNWATNTTNCMRYGLAYICPFWANGCSKLNFAHIPDGMAARTPHLEIERRLRAGDGILGAPDDADIVVLDATRVGEWFECEEKYRRLWEGDGLRESNEALEIASDMHSALAAHYETLKLSQMEVSNG